MTAHIVENHWPSLQHVTYVQTFRNLKLRYEQQQDRARDRSALDRLESIFIIDYPLSSLLVKININYHVFFNLQITFTVLLYFSVPSILRNNRFNRRDGNRTLDDDEELWFEQDDDIADSEEIMPMSDMLKSDMLKSSKIDEFDAFSMKYESKKGTLTIGSA